QHLIDVTLGRFPTSVTTEPIFDFLGQAFPVLGRALLDRTIQRLLEPYRERRTAPVSGRRSWLSSDPLRCHLPSFHAVLFCDVLARQKCLDKTAEACLLCIHDVDSHQGFR